VSTISEVADTAATGQRCDMKKNSTAPRENHPIEVMLLRSDTQDGAAQIENFLPKVCSKSEHISYRDSCELSAETGGQIL
jgi:hypothetical protein